MPSVNNTAAPVYQIAPAKSESEILEDRIIEQAMQIYKSRMKRVGVAFNGSKDVAEFLQLRLRELEHEVFVVLYLDTKHRLIEVEDMFRGSVNQTMVHPREVAKTALKYNASAVILAHNHPSGESEPSSGDIEVTKRLKSALQLLDIRVLDHIVVGSESTVSIADRGLM